MRLLHTSDWHLGAHLEAVSREPDHARFLDWLLATVEDRAIDALIVAGDVFDLAQPSAEAQRLYYRFLARAADTSLAKVVIVGGNHDSAARLDAPQRLLDTLDIHVVGGLGADTAGWDRCLCPITRDGEVLGAVCAVPFVHEYRLGVRTTRGEADEVRAAIRKAFRRLYKALADRAEARWPGVPLVATGHLTAGSARDDDYFVQIHQAQRVGALPASTFDRRFDYIALGHIHRMYGLDHRAAWYCGSPIPLRLPEAAEPRHVIEVELTPGVPARVTPLEIPTIRELITLEGDLDDVTARLPALTSAAPLPPLVYARVHVSRYDAQVPTRLQRALEAHPAAADARPILVNLRQIAQTPDEHTAPASICGVGPLRDLDPEAVFRRLCASREVTPDDALIAAFRSLISAGDGDGDGAATHTRRTPRQGELLTLDEGAA